MSNWTRNAIVRARAAISISCIWAVSWSFSGAVIGAVSWFFLARNGPPTYGPLPIEFLIQFYAVTGLVVGAIGGACFALLVTIGGAVGKLRSASDRRIFMYGATAGTLGGLLALLPGISAGRIPGWFDAAVFLLATSLLGWASGSLSLALEQRRRSEISTEGHTRTEPHTCDEEMLTWEGHTSLDSTATSSFYSTLESDLERSSVSSIPVVRRHEQASPDS